MIGRIPTSSLTAGLVLALCPAVCATPLDDLGFTALRALHPELTGAGQTVAQPEAPSGTAYQVNPAAVGQSAALFKYYDTTHAYGTAGAAFDPTQESGHADAVGDHLYGATGGGAPGVQAVLNFDANYFFNDIVARTTASHWRPVAISAPIVNQSFVFTETDPATISEVNRYYDAYAIKYGTLFINGLNNGTGTLTNAPASMYNGIAAGQSDGTHSGRAQIVAPGGATSFATPYVTAAAVVLRQAASLGYFQALSGTSATDARVLKAGLLNGATKTSGWTPAAADAVQHTSTDPLDATSGAGLLNVKNSFDTLAGGQHLASVSNLTAAGTISTGTAFSSATAIASFNGWDLASLTAGTTQDAVNHYFFGLDSQTAFTLTATLTWNSIVNTALILSTSGTDLINNFDLALIDTATNSLVWSSTSTTQNVEQIHLSGLTGSKYDLQVILRGGSGTPALTDTYALAWTWSANGIAAVPESHFAWVIGFSGVAFIVRKRLSDRNRRRRA